MPQSVKDGMRTRIYGPSRDLFQLTQLTISRQCGRDMLSSVSEVVANDSHHIHRNGICCSTASRQ